MDGTGTTVTVVVADVEEHPLPFVTVTVYAPPVDTVMVCEVDPVDHTFPLPAEEVKSTD